MNKVNIWIKENQGKHFCHCGCNSEIIIKKHHYSRGISEYVKGHCNKDKHFSEEHKIKLSESHKGNYLSQETKKKISIATSGENNPNWKEKIKKICICGKEFEVRPHLKNRIYCSNKCGKSGKNNPNYGNKMSEESKNRIAIRHIGNKYNLGRRVTDEIKKKISDNHANVSGKNNPSYGKPRYHAKRYYYESPLQGKISFRSSWELAYAKYLDVNKILWMYEMETFDLDNITYTPDFFLPQTEQFIEIKGYMSDKAQEKINKFLAQYSWNLKILRKADLIKLGVIINGYRNN